MGPTSSDRCPEKTQAHRRSPLGVEAAVGVVVCQLKTATVCWKGGETRTRSPPELPEEASPASTLVSNFWPPEMRAS